jgi:hypothetical protein
MDINEQNRAYYESLEQDMEKEMLKEIKEIDRQTKMKEREIEKKLQLELELKKQKELELEMKQNQPTKDELRQRRLKFYENKK